MKNFLAKKWLGPLALFLYTLCLSLFLTHQITPSLKEFLPLVTQEAKDFLPIVIQNGEIVEPQNKVVSKNYATEDGESLTIVLDTRTDTLDLNTLHKDGIYLSRKCIYIVSPKESKMQCLDSDISDEPIVITEEMVKNFMEKVDQLVDAFLSTFLIVTLFISFYLIILFYTVVMHWVVALLFKIKFGQTLFVNTFLYAICNLLEIIIPIDLSIWVKLILFVCINLLICKAANERK